VYVCMYDGGTPLNIAAQKGHEDVTEQLIEALCDVDLPYNDGHK
jgi:ankyrin repeat protein